CGRGIFQDFCTVFYIQRGIWQLQLTTRDNGRLKWISKSWRAENFKASSCFSMRAVLPKDNKSCTGLWMFQTLLRALWPKQRYWRIDFLAICRCIAEQGAALTHSCLLHACLVLLRSI